MQAMMTWLGRLRWSVRGGLLALGFAILIVLSLAACRSVPPPKAPRTFVDPHGRLSVRGNRLVDEHGEPIVLRGMSLYWSQWKGQFYNTNAVRWLRDDWHCTVVRAAMAVGSGGYLRDPEREKAKVRTVVDAAIRLGMYVIIDWHVLREGPNTVTQAQAFFAEMATTYAKYPNVIYELWNEPLNNQDWSTVIKPYHEAVIPKLREHDARNLIVCGTQTWSQDVDKVVRDPLHFSNIAYTLHFYAGTHRQSLRNKALHALTNGIPLFVTEWGTSPASGNGAIDLVETRRWLDFTDQHQLSWCNWSIADLQESSAALRPGADGNGGWETNRISPSGMFVREDLRTKNPGP